MISTVFQGAWLSPRTLRFDVERFQRLPALHQMVMKAARFLQPAVETDRADGDGVRPRHGSRRGKPIEYEYEYEYRVAEYECKHEYEYLGECGAGVHADGPSHARDTAAGVDALLQGIVWVMFTGFTDVRVRESFNGKPQATAFDTRCSSKPASTVSFRNVEATARSSSNQL